MIDELFDNAPCGYFSFFDDGTLYVVNETVCSLLGYEKAELKGKNVESIFTLPTRIFYQTHFFPLVKMHGHAEEIFLSLRTKHDQYLPVLLNAKRVEDSTPYTTCAFIVVPNRKKFEDELVNARNEAEKALKENSELQKAKNDLQVHSEELDIQIQTVKRQNDELKQFNHVVTHSLKEPVRKISVYVEKMQVEGMPDRSKMNFARLAKASEQMKQIVSGLQQYIWLLSAANHYEIIDLYSLITKLVLRLCDEGNPEPVVTIAGDIPAIEADREQVQLLLYHILSNAMKFKRGERATITVAGTIIKLNSFKAILHKYKYEDFLKLDIGDEGVGFDPIYKDDVFELFKRLDNTNGQGLGLALCKKIAENHSGSIEAYSRVNEFTTITIYLPVVQRANA